LLFKSINLLVAYKEAVSPQLRLFDNSLLVLSKVCKYYYLYEPFVIKVAIPAPIDLIVEAIFPLNVRIKIAPTAPTMPLRPPNDLAKLVTLSTIPLIVF